MRSRHTTAVRDLAEVRTRAGNQSTIEASGLLYTLGQSQPVEARYPSCAWSGFSFSLARWQRYQLVCTAADGRPSNEADI